MMTEVKLFRVRDAIEVGYFEFKVRLPLRSVTKPRSVKDITVNDIAQVRNFRTSK